MFFLVTSVFHRRCKKRSVINNVSCRIQLIQWKVERMLPCGDDALWSVNSDLPVTSDSDFQMHWRIQKKFAVMWKSTVASISRQNNTPKVLPQEDRMAHPGARCRHDGTPWRQSPSCWRISGRRAEWRSGQWWTISAHGQINDTRDVSEVLFEHES